MAYTAIATTTAGRNGHVESSEGTLKLDLSMPGSGKPGTNPEQLFAAGYSACFLGAMKFVASQGGPKVPAATTVTATVGIGPRSEGGFGITAELQIALPGLSPEDATKLAEAAHQVCPYSNATRGNVDVKLVIA